MLRPRWKKVLRDLVADRTRTLLVVLSIAVGVFAVGAILTTRVVLAENLTASYLSINPASATLTTAPFDDELVRSVSALSGVAAAQGQRAVAARVQTGPNNWQSAVLYVVPDDGLRAIATLVPAGGAWPPRDKTLLLERSSLARSPAAVGEPLRVTLPGQATRDLPVAGLVHDLSLAPAASVGQVVGYLTFDTLVWLGGPRSYNQLQIVVAEQRGDAAHIEAVAAQAARSVERSGRRVLATDVPTPLQHPAADVLPAVFGLLTAMSVMALLISTFLIVNTIGAILTQQTRQIGVMKAIGARIMQLAAMYFTLAAAFGGLALLLAVPLGYLAATGLTHFLGGLFNVEITQMRLPLEVVLIQACAAVLVPLVAAAFPIRGVVSRPTREALAGNTEASGADGWLDRLLRRLPGLSRPSQLALRNTFRRKGRLVRTLAALALGGAVFISVLSLQAALNTTLVAVLALMALLIGVVGGLGLSGTMSINVLERTREIGVMRAIGAGDGAIRQVIVSEGLAMAGLAWLLATALSIPLSYLMSVGLGLALLNTPLTWVYSFLGLGLWLGIMLLLAVLASLLPARSAVRLTVREVLAYE